MTTNPVEPRELYFSQNFAFSTNYLEYEIPDFRVVVEAAVPVLVFQDKLLAAAEGNTVRLLDAQLLSALIGNILSRAGNLLCNNTVAFHCIALEMAGDNTDLRDMVWRLTDIYSLWDVPLLEQRLIWATEGRATDRLDFEELLTKYQVPKTTSSLDGLHEIFQSQFTRLVEGLPFLKNDIAGRRVFREHEYDSPYIPAPRRVLARDNIHFKERLHIFLPLIEGWQKYGPACIGLEVQAAIVGYYQQANRYNTASEAKSLYHRKKVELRDGLKGLPKCYVSFKQFHEDGSPVYTEDAGKELNKRWRATTRHQKPTKPPEATKNDANGSIRSESSKTVPDFLRKTRKLLRLDERFSQRERSFPCQQDGQLSLNPTHWSEILPPSGPLRCWADYHAASQAEHFTSTQSTKLYFSPSIN